MSGFGTSRNGKCSIVLGGIATIAAILTNAGPASGAPAAAPRHLSFSAKLTSFHAQNAPKHGARAGETFQFTDVLKQGGSNVGHDAGSGTYVDPNHFEIAWTLEISGGSLQISGLGRPTNDPYHLAVVGGTGKYADATGTMTVTDANNAVGHYHLVLH